MDSGDTAYDKAYDSVTGQKAEIDNKLVWLEGCLSNLLEQRNSIDSKIKQVVQARDRAIEDKVRAMWFAGDAEGLDADFAYVVREWVRIPRQGLYDVVDYGESRPVAICQTQADRDTIIAEHNATCSVELLSRGSAPDLRGLTAAPEPV